MDTSYSSDSITPLRSLLAETQPLWSVSDLSAAETKLAQIGVHDAETLAEALSSRLNDRLRKVGQRTFTADTVRALRQRLGVQLKPSRKRKATRTSSSAPLLALTWTDDGSCATSEPKDNDNDSCFDDIELQGCKLEEGEHLDSKEASVDILPPRQGDDSSDSNSQSQELAMAAGQVEHGEQTEDFFQDVEYETSEPFEVHVAPAAPELPTDDDPSKNLCATAKMPESRPSGFPIDERRGSGDNLGDETRYRKASPSSEQPEVPQSEDALVDKDSTLALDPQEKPKLSGTPSKVLKTAMPQARSRQTMGSKAARATSRRQQAVEAKHRGVHALSTASWEEGQEEFLEARRLDPHDKMTLGLLELAQLQSWEALGIPVLASRTFETARQIASKWSQMAFEAKTDGYQALQEGNFCQAISLLSQAVVLDMTDEVAQRLLQGAKLQQWLQATKDQEPHFREAEYKKGAAAQQRSEAEHRDGQVHQTIGMTEICHLDNFHSAEDLARHKEEIAKATTGSLQSWCYNAGIAWVEDLNHDEMVALLQRRAFLQAAPMSYLIHECSVRGIEVPKHGDSEDIQKQQLADDLLLEEARQRWGILGLLASSIDDAERSKKVREEQRHIAEAASSEELKRRYSAAGLPEDERLSKDELVELLQKMVAWEAVSLESLKEEAARLQSGVDAALAVEGDDDNEEARRRLLRQLSLGQLSASWERRGLHWKLFGSLEACAEVVERLERGQSWSDEELARWYVEDCALPFDASQSADDNRRLFEQVTVWTSMLPKELRAECSSRGVFFRDLDFGSDDSSGSSSASLVKRLVMDEKFRIWDAKGLRASEIRDPERILNVIEQQEQIHHLPLADLKAWYSSLGLPEESLARSDLIDLAKLLPLWEALPLEHLQAECRKWGVPLETPTLETSTEHGEDGKDHKEELSAEHLDGHDAGEVKSQHTLMRDLLVQRRLKAWDEQGFQSFRVENPELVMQAVEQFESLKALDLTELRQTWLEACLPGTGLSLGREEMLACLKLAMVWEILPFKELRTECEDRKLSSRTSPGTLGLRTSEERRQELINRLKASLAKATHPS